MLSVGNVYPCHGGYRAEGAYWVVIALTDTGAVCVRVTHDGTIVGAANYGRHVFDGSSKYFQRHKTLIGTCAIPANLKLKINFGRF